jgi:hypothetical protein
VGRPRSLWGVGAGCLVLAALSLLAPWTPTYDSWAWLIWGREVGALDLDTTAGPAWKPLPVLVTTVLAPLGAAAPALWLVLARTGGLLAVALAFRLAARLGGGRAWWFAGGAAALGLLATTGFLRGVAGGSSEGLLIALLLLAVDRHLDGRHRQALALATAASLLRPEAWLFLGAYAVWLWRRDPGSRSLVAASVAVVPVLWFAPELWGSGDLLRSSERARIPNPGQPALAEQPAFEVVQGFLEMLAPPVILLALCTTALALWRRERAPVALAAGTAAWVGLVAVMAEAGFSGEDRYLLAAAAPVAILTGIGAGGLLGVVAARAPHAAAPVGVAALAVALVASVSAAGRLADELAYAAELRTDLAAAVERAGGSERLRSCGPLYAGRYRFPLVAWYLRAHISELGLTPTAPGVVLRSKLTPEEPTSPPVPEGFELLAREGAWEVHAACAA